MQRVGSHVRITVSPPCPICRKSIFLSGQRPNWEVQMHAHVMEHMYPEPADS